MSTMKIEELHSSETWRIFCLNTHRYTLRGRATAQSVSRWLTNAVARVRARF
jgi:hypothetical protein